MSRRAFTDLQIGIFVDSLNVIVIGILCTKQNGLSNSVGINILYINIGLLVNAEVFAFEESFFLTQKLLYFVRETENTQIGLSVFI